MNLEKNKLQKFETLTSWSSLFLDEFVDSTAHARSPCGSKKDS